MRASIARALVTEPELLLMDEPFAALDEITRFKLNNDLLALWQELRRTVIFVTHSVFESVYLSQRIVVMTPRPGRVFTEIAIAAPYPRDERFRTSADYAGYCRQVSEALGTGDGGRRVMSDRALRIGLPILVLALGRAGLGSGRCALFAIPPYVLPGPGLVLATLIADGGLLWQSLLVTLTITFEGFLLAAIGGIALAIAVQPMAAGRILALSLRGHPAGDADRRHRAAAADLSAAALGGAGLRLDRGVLPGAGQHHARPATRSTTICIALFELYKASRWQVLWNLKLPAALPQMLAGLRIAGGLSLIGAVVAEIAAGSAGAGSGLAYRIAESGYRLNIPRMFAALLLLSLAGVAIFFALSALSHLALRRWHESAIKRER